MITTRAGRARSLRVPCGVHRRRGILRALSTMTARFRPGRSRSKDEVEAQALAGNDWGAEAQPKITEFQTERAAKAMTFAEFEKIV
jgi:hypothetical protein